MSAGAAGAGAAAAAAAAEQLRQEEEQMTPYTADDLGGEWEFKILRSNFATFKDPEKLRAILEEEARSGWVLLEKFDDQRVRLKRPVTARALDAKSGLDPYRTTVPGDAARVAMLLAAIFGAMGLVPLIILGTRALVVGSLPVGVLLLALGVALILPTLFLAVRRSQAGAARRRDANFDDF